MRTLLTFMVLAAAVQAQNGSDHYKIDFLVPPKGERVEVGGLDFLPDGRLVCSTRRGQVWIVENPLAEDPADAVFNLFCDGLFEGLGLEVVGDDIYVLQRTELSRLRDSDGDGRCDSIETITNDWGSSGNYHEFAFGLPRDAEDNFYIGLNVSFDDPWWLGKSPVPYRGWVLKLTPEGEVVPFASGLRSPCGLGLSPEGELFVTDNQGDWVATSPIYHVRQGAFYGHPASLRWTEPYLEKERLPSLTFPPERERAPAAIYIPYDWSRSTGDLAWDQSGGRFGPFDGQAFVAELTNGRVLRVQFEKVRAGTPDEVIQGAVFPFASGVGSAIRVRFAPNGTLFCGLTDRGWGGQPPGDGIARVSWTGRVPFEMKSVHLVQDGFEIEFTHPVAAQSENEAQFLLEQYDYNYWWEYGSPVRDPQELELSEVRTLEDGRTILLRAPGLRAGMVARLRIEGLQSIDGAPLLHNEMAYTVNQLPTGAITRKLITHKVPPPTIRERWDEGTLWLMDGDASAAWEQSGWSVAEVELHADDPTRFAALPPVDDDPARPKVLTNFEGDSPTELVSRLEFGDVDVHVEFMLPKGGNSGIYLMGRYELQLLDSSGKADEALTFGDCGGIYQGADEPDPWTGRAPTFNAFKGPGRWHWLDISFQAPRFDAQGSKIAHAKFVRVKIDDTLLHEDVEVSAPTRGAWPGEVPIGPLRLQGDHGPVAFRNIRVRLRKPEQPEQDSGWTSIFNGEHIEDWKISEGGEWRVDEGMIVGSGARSHLFSPRSDYRNFELRAKVRINSGGNSGMYFRAAFGDGWPAGYEAQVNSNHSDPVKTGSLYGLSSVLTKLVPHDTWFEQHVICRDAPGGVHITILVNGVVVVDTIDAARKHAAGHIAFQQHHEGSLVQYKDVQLRELE